MKSKYIILSLFLFVGLSSFAQFKWHGLTPIGNSIIGFTMDDDGIMHIVRDVSPYLMISTDKGVTWESTNTSLDDDFDFMKFYKAFDGELFLVLEDNLFKWSGSIWEEQILSLSGRLRDISKLPNGRIVLQQSSSAYISDESGNNFSLLHEEWGNSDFYSTPGSNNNFLVISNANVDYLYKFDDDGGNFRRILSNVTLNAYGLWSDNNGIVIISGFNQFLRSEDGGENWKEITFNALNPPRLANIEEWEGGILAAYSSHGVFTSNDKGANWNLASDLGMFKNIYSSVRIFQDGPNSFYTCHTDGVSGLFHSADNLNNWEETIINFQTPTVSKFVKNSFTNRMYVRTVNRIQFSENSGRNWEFLQLPNDEFPRLIGPVIDFHSSDSEYIFFTNNNGEVYRSSDNGENWQDITPNVPFPTTFSFHINPHNKRLFLLSSTGIISFYSEDNGANWVQFDLLSIHTNCKVTFIEDGRIFYTNNYSTNYWQENVHSDLKEFVLPTFSDPFSRPGPITVLSDGSVFSYISNEDKIVFFDIETGEIESSVPYLWRETFVTNQDDLIARNFIGRKLNYSRDFGVTWDEISGDLPQDISIKYIFEDASGYIYVTGADHKLYVNDEPLSPKKRVTIRAYRDIVEDCIIQPADEKIPHFRVQAKTSNSLFTTQTDDRGLAFLPLPFGKYDFNPQVNETHWEQCIINEEITVDESNPSTVYFLLQPKTNCADLKASATFGLFRRCFDSNQLAFKVCNDGTTTSVNSTLSFELDSFLIIVNHDFPNLNQEPGTNTYTVELDELEPFECQRFKVRLEVDCQAELGQVHCIEVLAEADNQCNSVKPYKLCEANIGSFDPNDKNAYIEGIQEDSFVEPNQPIEYLIRFQNTGTDTAFTVRIEDQLSQFLNPSSVEIIDFSHPMNYELTDGGSLIFHFENIMLPDSNINEPLSHGFVKFLIEQETDVERGNYILNEAGIYFDFNDPVITNEVALRVGNYVSTKEIGESNYLHIYPNPTNTNFSIQLEKEVSGQLTIEVFDIFGKAVFEDTFRGKNYRAEKADLTQGTYLVRISGKEMKPLTRKLVKM